MKEKIVEEVAKRFYGKFFDDVIGYWRIYDHLKNKFIARREGIIELKNENEFWYSLLNKQYCGKGSPEYKGLKSGQVIRMKDMFITEWAPKMPGQLWTLKGSADLIEGFKSIDKTKDWKDGLYSVLDPWGKSKVLSAGFGSIRISPQINSDDFCMYTSLVSAENWHSDYGIPTIVSKSVYKEIKKYGENGASWIEELEGILIIDEEIPIKDFIPSAIGSNLSREVEDALRFKPFLPKCYIYISSPLAIKIKYNNTHPDSVGWTVFETSSEHDQFRYTYSTFNPFQEESIVNTVEFINYYVGEYDGTKIITDFDGQRPRLESFIPIDTDPQLTKKKEFSEVIAKMDNWSKRRLTKIRNGDYF